MPPPQTLPDAAAQQQAAVEVFAQHEPPLYEAYLEMMLEWLAAVKAAMFAGGIVRLALMPDPMTIFSLGPQWAAIAAKYTAQVARDVLAAPYRDLFANDTLFDSRPFVRNWIADTDNRLSAVPDQVFGLVSQIIDSAATNGASIPDVQQQIEQLFGATGQQTWKNRARTVARTEVVGAYNGGLHDAFAMIVESDPGTKYVHRWLATEDQRTRPDHREADGQVQPWGEPFQLGPGGTVLMMHPHALGAPANQVVNCRCVELLEEEGDPTPMGNRQYKGGFTLAAAAHEFGFNPLQKRNKDGEWTKGGGLLKSFLKGPGGGEKEPEGATLGKSYGKDLEGKTERQVAEMWRSGKLQKKGYELNDLPGGVQDRITGKKAAPDDGAEDADDGPSGPSGPSSGGGRDGGRRNGPHGDIIGLPEDWSRPEKDPRFKNAAYGADALAQMTKIDDKPKDQADALGRYGLHSFKTLNASLSKGEALGAADQKLMDTLDTALAPEGRTKDVVLWRGMRRPAAKFGDAWNGTDVTGLEWSQGGFSSTSADYGVAAGFGSGDDGVLMRVLLPKNVQVGAVDMRGKANSNQHEAEALLGRNVRYRVVADHPAVGSGKRILDVEVVA